MRINLDKIVINGNRPCASDTSRGTADSRAVSLFAAGYGIICRTARRLLPRAMQPAQFGMCLASAQGGRLVACILVLLSCHWPSVGHAQIKHLVPTQEPAVLNLNFCRPAYPPGATRRREQGSVKLEFTIGANGRLVGSRIVKSSGYRDLDQAALTALIHCAFKPAYRNDVPLQASFTMDYQWKLPQ